MFLNRLAAISIKTRKKKLRSLNPEIFYSQKYTKMMIFGDYFMILLNNDDRIIMKLKKCILKT